MDSFKTARGECTVSDDTLHIRERISARFYRLAEFNLKWLGLLLFACSLFGISFYYGGPRTFDRLLGFGAILIVLVVISVFIGLVLFALLNARELRRRISEARKADAPVILPNRALDIPLASVSSVEKTEVYRSPALVVNYSVTGTEKQAHLFFYPGMREEMDRALNLLEARDIPV